INFKESEDGKMMTASIEMSGVPKHDMHVTFRSNRVIITWRRIRMVEKKEGDVLVREKHEKQYNQIIPLPEGTKFDEIRASRDGRRLKLTYPNTRILR
ncbi:hypothetical protein K474DRAFT_1568778, partial [Panus rudis PR-1116 ss-1]